MAEPDFRTGNELPVTHELLASLADDYNAGRLPDDIKARIDSLRDDYYENLGSKFVEMQDGLKPGIEEFTRDVLAQMKELESTGVIVNSEEIDSRQIPVAVSAVEQEMDKLVMPVLDAFEVTVHTIFDFAREIVEIRCEHDPEGRFAEKLAASGQELSDADGQFDSEMDALHIRVDGELEALGQLRTEAEEFHESHAPIRILNSTTVDPGLQEQTSETAGEGVA